MAVKTLGNALRNSECKYGAMEENMGNRRSCTGAGVLDAEDRPRPGGGDHGCEYRHSLSNVDLIGAAKTWVSDKLCKEVFGERSLANGIGPVPELRLIVGRLACFALENPEFSRVWLQEVLSASDPEAAPFLNMYFSAIDKFIESNIAQSGIDAEVFAVALLIWVFLCPDRAKIVSHCADGGRNVVVRYTEELLQHSVCSALLREAIPNLEILSEGEMDLSGCAR